MSGFENRYCCDSRARNVVVRVDIGPIVAVISALVFAVLIARADVTSSPAQPSHGTKAAVHRKVTVIPMGDTASDKTIDAAPSPVPVKGDAEGGEQ